MTAGPTNMDGTTLRSWTRSQNPNGATCRRTSPTKPSFHGRTPVSWKDGPDSYLTPDLHLGPGE